MCLLNDELNSFSQKRNVCVEIEISFETSPIDLYNFNSTLNKINALFENTALLEKTSKVYDPRVF